MASKVRLQWRQKLELGCSRWEEKVDTSHTFCHVRRRQREDGGFVSI